MKRAKVNKVKCFSLCVYDCIRRKPERKRWMPNEWKRSEGKTHGGKDCVRREWMSEKNTVTNLRYCRQTPICGSSLWKLWLLSESSDWSTLRDKLLDFFSGGSSDSTIQNKELFCVGMRKFRFTINAKPQNLLPVIQTACHETSCRTFVFVFKATGIPLPRSNGCVEFFLGPPLFYSKNNNN